MSLTNSPKMIFYKNDDKGFILNSLENDAEVKKFHPLYNKIKETLIKVFAKNTHSIYFHKNKYINKENQERIFIHIILLSFTPQEIPSLKSYIENWSKEFKVDIRINFDSIEGFFWNTEGRFSLKTKFICIHGYDIKQKIMPFKPNWEIAFNYNLLELELDEGLKLIKECNNKEQLKKLCTKTMFRVLMASFEICMERENKYTRDPYTMYKVFAKYYPDKESIARKVLALNQKPSEKTEEILSLLHLFGKWIILNGNLLKVEKLLIK